MIKSIALAAVISATLLGAAVLPAQASVSQSDCAFAQRQIDQGIGPRSGSAHNPYAATLIECSMQH
jgi:hypothetical protein